MESSNKKGFTICPQKLRNICIMAHVDHGKTTLADALIATNGIITHRQAGKIRYMDSREDEIERGITMKSSCVTLTHKKNDDVYIINLIDSPGHVDFSSEVSTAVRLCDGTIIVVDVVEGVCAQTKVVLRQAWMENIRPVLLFNKIDRLIIEMKFSPLDAYYHINKVLEQVNAFMGELYNTDVFGRMAEEEELQKLARERKDSKCSPDSAQTTDITDVQDTDAAAEWSLHHPDDSDLYFSPESGNVAFASAYDGWGFQIRSFAEKYHKKFNLEVENLNRGLWGNFYISSKGGQKEISGNAREKAKSPLFVSLILDNIFKVYDAVYISKDPLELEKIAKSLGLKIPTSIVKGSDFRLKLNYIMTNWLPLADTVLGMVITHHPGASEVSEERARKLMCTATQRFESLPPQTQMLRDAFVKCSSQDDAPLIVYVSKMFGVEKRHISERAFQTQKQVPCGPSGVVSLEEIESRRKQISDRDKEVDGSSKAAECDLETDEIAEEEQEELIAFARVFSGSLRTGQEVLVLGPKHSPNALLSAGYGEHNFFEGGLENFEHISKSQVKGIYLLMGRQLEGIKSAPAGSIVGIAGLEGIHKSATLSSTPFCPPFTELTHQATPILRVAVEPVDPKYLPKLRKGLKILDKADPCVEVCFEDSGEYVIVTAGEVHLQRCVRDLQERYARVPLSVSSPIVPFRETLIPPPTVDRLNEAIHGENVYTDPNTQRNGVYEVENNIGRLKVQAYPLPSSVVSLLEEHSRLLPMISKLAKYHSKTSEIDASDAVADKCDNIQPKNTKCDDLSSDVIAAINSLRINLKKAFESSENWEQETVDQIWSFGPHSNGCNILINRIPGYTRPSVWGNGEKNCVHPLEVYDASFVAGFQMATAAGPLSEEPMMGVCFIIEDWHVSDLSSESSVSNVMGQVISMTKDALRKACENGHQRLMCAMYSCMVSLTSEVVGKFYNLIGKRHGRVMDGTMTEGSTSWNVATFIPVVESMDFATELRKCTSGEAIPQLMFSHWETLQIDPFWEPQTTEEVTHWGEKADAENLAMKYINAVRKRKGLSTEEKIVQSAEKQRNLSKNK